MTRYEIKKFFIKLEQAQSTPDDAKLNEDFFSDFAKKSKEIYEAEGVNFTDCSYKDNEYFKSQADEEILMGRYATFMRPNELIEKYAIAQEIVEDNYGCYDLRVTRPLSPIEQKKKTYYDSLCMKYPEENLTYKDIDQFFYRSPKNDFKRNSEPGLVNVLQKLGLDINNEAFDVSQRIRLLYNLYCFIKDNNVYLYPFLNNPTLENVIHNHSGKYTKNGKLMEELLRYARYGVKATFISDVNNVIKKVHLMCESICENLVQNIDLFDEESLLSIQNGTKKCFEEKLKEFSQESVDTIYNDQKASDAGSDNDLLSVFYLKLRLHGEIGRLIDINDAEKFVLDNYSDAQNLILDSKYLSQFNGVVSCEKAKEWYIDNIDRIAEAALGGKASRDDRRKCLIFADLHIVNCVKIVQNETPIRYSNHLPQKYLVILTRILLNYDKTNIVENKFYRYQTKDQKSLNSTICGDFDEAFEKNLIVFAELVYNIYCSSYSNREKLRIIREIEYELNLFVISVFSLNNLDDIRKIYQTLYSVHEICFGISKEEINDAIQEYYNSLFSKKNDALHRK